ncbi:hypothetical protein PQX77_012024 [Marasmius sp. AFHP31]|nr:hypothetical protein PQX77_012024 [Marasmius sp. AFHP31]
MEVDDPGRLSAASDPVTFSVFISFGEAGVKSGSDGSAETTYVEEIRNSQAIEFTGTTPRLIPASATATVVGTRVQSSNGYWVSQDIPVQACPVTFGTATTTLLNFQTCSLLADGKYGCIEKLPGIQRLEITTAYTNSANQFVATDVGGVENDNNGAAIGFTSTITWQIVSVVSAMLVGVWVVL